MEGTSGNHWWWTGLRKNEEGWRWGSGQGFILEVLCISNMCLWFFLREGGEGLVFGIWEDGRRRVAIYGFDDGKHAMS